MRRTSRLPRARFMSAACLAIAMVTGTAVPSATAKKPLPPQAKYRGQTVAEWSFLHNEWAIATGLGQQTALPDTVKRMRFLPPGFGPGDFEFDVVVSPGTGIVSAPFFAFGELYEDGSFDHPDDEFLAFLLDLVLTMRSIEVRLDGEIVQSGTPAELGGFTYGPTFFDVPILYNEPQDRGGILAIRAL